MKARVVTHSPQTVPVPGSVHTTATRDDADGRVVDDARRARTLVRQVAAQGHFILWTMTKNRVVARAEVCRQPDGLELSISIAGEFTWARRYAGGAVSGLVREVDDQYFDFVRRGWRVEDRAALR